MLLADKICIVTGAASARGIGRATARLFALHGGRAIILDLNGDAAAAAASDLGDAHRGYACDVTDKAACEAAPVIRQILSARSIAAFSLW